MLNNEPVTDCCANCGHELSNRWKGILAKTNFVHAFCYYCLYNYIHSWSTDKELARLQAKKEMAGLGVHFNDPADDVNLWAPKSKEE